MSRLQTSSMAALLGAHTSSFGFTAGFPSTGIGVLRSDKNFPTRPLIVFVFPVPGGLRSQLSILVVEGTVSLPLDQGETLNGHGPKYSFRLRLIDGISVHSSLDSAGSKMRHPRRSTSQNIREQLGLVMWKTAQGTILAYSGAQPDFSTSPVTQARHSNLRKVSAHLPLGLGKELALVHDRQNVQLDRRVDWFPLECLHFGQDGSTGLA